MLNDGLIRCVALAGTLTASLAFAQGEGPVAVPTYSIEAVEVNGIAIAGAPVKEVAVAPGDVITAKFFVCDWSPAGEKLRAYQIKVDDASYSTGDQGVVQPVGLQANPERDPNAFIDESDPRWVHYGRPTIPIVDSASPGYRWLSVLLDPYEGPVSAQDGKKFSCATLKLTPSANAHGTFNIAMVEDPFTTSLITTDNEQIPTVNYERLTVKVSREIRWRRLLSSDPPDGAVDARRTPGKSWNAVRLSFNCESGNLSPDDVIIEDGTPSPPRVKRVVGEGNEVTIELDRPIRAGGWTTITHKASKTTTRVGSFPGDANGDGRADSKDVLTLVRALNGSELMPIHRSDVDGNGSLGAGDLLAVLDLVAIPSSPRTR